MTEANDFIMEGKRARQLVPACAHLELRLPQIEREGVTPYLTGVRTSDADRKVLSEFIMNNGDPLSRKFEPYCSKTGSLCVVMESPVTSMGQTGGMYQPLAVTVMNTDRLEKCKHREIPPNAMAGTLTLFPFIIYGIAKAIRKPQEDKT